MEQLKKLFNYFEKENVLILKSSDFFSDTGQELMRIFNFLEIDSSYKLENIQAVNYFGEYSGMSEDVHNWLIDYFKPYNNELFSLLGWESF